MSVEAWLKKAANSPMIDSMIKTKCSVSCLQLNNWQSFACVRKQTTMLLFFMRVPVAGVIVPDVTAISASVRSKLEMNIHFVIFKFPLFIESFSTKVTDKPLVLLRRVNTSDVILHAENHDAAEIALLRLHTIS